SASPRQAQPLGSVKSMAVIVIREFVMAEQKPSETSGSGCGCLIATLIAIFLIWSSNPSLERHKQAYFAYGKKHHPIQALFGGGQFASAFFQYHSYFICSRTTIAGET